MTLNEKMLQTINRNIYLDADYEINNKDGAANECEAIAVEFVDELNKWCLENDIWQVTDDESSEYRKWVDPNADTIMTYLELITLYKQSLIK